VLISPSLQAAPTLVSPINFKLTCLEDENEPNPVASRAQAKMQGKQEINAMWRNMHK